MGITLQRTKDKFDILSQTFTKEIYDAYINGNIKSSDLPVILGANRYTIELYMKKNGLKFRQEILKESINEFFFDCIDTEEKAYMLGYYFADGTCSVKAGRITMSQT